MNGAPTVTSGGIITIRAGSIGVTIAAKVEAGGRKTPAPR
jgi:hypothetical protein